MIILRDIVPCGHRVLVKLAKPKDEVVRMSAGGIITQIADKKTLEAEKHAMQEAYVVDIGPSAFRIFGDGAPWCKVGDLVLIAKYSGEDRTDIEEDAVYRIINDENIFAVFRGESLA